MAVRQDRDDEHLIDQPTDLYTLDIDDPGAVPVSFDETPAGETQPRFSPSGRWVAYTSDETGAWHVYVRPYPGPGGRCQVSSTLSGGGAAGPGAGRPFRSGVPRRVRTDMPRAEVLLSEDLSHDGKAMFIPVNEDDQTRPEEIRVVVNWFEEVGDTER